MKRILYDVPLWHLMLHREHRGMPRAKPGDRKSLLIEDELFEVLYAGEGTPTPKEDVNPVLGPWAERVHAACRELPHFQRLAADCRGDAAAAAIAVDTLIEELALPDGNDLAPGAAPGSAKDPLRRPLQAACATAGEAIQAYRDAADGLAGLAFGPAAGTDGAPNRTTDLERVRPLLSLLRENHKLRRVAQLAGRFKRIAAEKRRQRVRHGADDLTDIEQGAELGRALPSEMAKLHHPVLRKEFLRAFLERQVLQYQLVGNDTLTCGPLVVLLDKSTSMDDSHRDEWAAAVALALLDHAAAQRRPFALVTFTDRIVGETVVRPGGTLPWDAFTVPSEAATDISRAVGRGLDLIAAGPPPFRKADVVLITDGASDAAEGPALRERAKALQTTVFGVAIGNAKEVLAPWCDQLHAATTLSTLDSAIAADVFG